MESGGLKNPKDDKIINKDDAVTNKDGDNNLEKGKLPTDEKKADNKLREEATNEDTNTEEEEEGGSSERKVRLAGEYFVI